MSIAFEGAFIREQGVDFAVVVVRRCVLQSKSAADKLIASLSMRVDRPVVLMAQDARGTPTWYGRRDITRFMSDVPLAAVPWRRITFH